MEEVATEGRRPHGQRGGANSRAAKRIGIETNEATLEHSGRQPASNQAVATTQQANNNQATYAKHMPCKQRQWHQSVLVKSAQQTDTL